MIVFGSSLSPFVRKTLAFATEKGIAVEVKPVGAVPEKARVGDYIERRNAEFGTPPPDVQGEVGPDPGGLAKCQCQRLHGAAFIA